MARARVRGHKRKRSDGRIIQVREHKRRRAPGEVVVAALDYLANNFVRSPLAMKFAVGFIGVGVGAAVLAAAGGMSLGMASVLMAGVVAAAVSHEMNRPGSELTGKKVIAAPLVAIGEVVFGQLPPARPAVGNIQPAISDDYLTEEQTKPDKRQKQRKTTNRNLSDAGEPDVSSLEMSREKMPADPNYDANRPEGLAAGYDRPGLQRKQPFEFKRESYKVKQLKDGTITKTGEVVDVDGQVYRFTATNVTSELTPGKPGTLLWENGIPPSVDAANQTWKKVFSS